jgi:excinuclease ABC subunit C
VLELRVNLRLGGGYIIKMTDAFELEEKVKRMPECPGVYIMHDAAGTIIYVGKAVNLHSRVRSYFSMSDSLSPKTQTLVSKINDIEYYVTKTEQEALILELHLIKSHKPHYNVRLKDDKSYPYLMIDLGEEWPRLHITRRYEKGNNRYFGPFTDVGSLRATLKVLKRVFPLRSCNKPITGTAQRPCLDYHIHNCSGPCIGAVTKEEYAEIIAQVIHFLEGKQEQVAADLQVRMGKASAAMDFEKAAIFRDKYLAVQKVITEQRIAMAVREVQDAVAFAQENDHACVQVFMVRNGMLIGRESFILQGTHDEAPSEIMASFVKQFYNETPSIPPSILLQYSPDDKELIEGWLGERRGGRVRIAVPKRGDKKQLMRIVAENARRALEQYKIREMTNTASLNQALTELKNELNLPKLPSRIEGYDISNIQGKDAVGSMVVFHDGKPKSSLYRRFKIKTVAGADDYAMLREVLKRRFKRATFQDTETAQGDWTSVPDLVLIDGGKGQLNAALEALKEVEVLQVPVMGLAKENEEIYLPDRSKPLVLPKSSPGLQLLQRLRDEAHRFAIGYHQKVHKKGAFASALDGIPGLGPKRRRALLKYFGSVKAIREASVEEMAKAGSMSVGLAQVVKKYL